MPDMMVMKNLQYTPNLNNGQSIEIAQYPLSLLFLHSNGTDVGR